MSGRSVTIFLPASSGRAATTAVPARAAPDDDTHEQALLGGRAASKLKCGSGLHGHNLVDEIGVEGVGHEVGHEALDAVRAGGTAGEQR